MKNHIIPWALSALLLGAGLSACNSPAEKVENAQEDVIEAEKALTAAKIEAANEAEWGEFKAAAQARIAENDAKIATLKRKKAGPGTALDPAYEKQIESLEMRSHAIQTRIDDYERYHSDWATFKRELSEEMDELGRMLQSASADETK